MTNYWSEKTQIWEDDAQNKLIDANYNNLMNNLQGHTFAQFMAEAGITQRETTKFLVNAIEYVINNPDAFSS